MNIFSFAQHSAIAMLAICLLGNNSAFGASAVGDEQPVEQKVIEAEDSLDTLFDQWFTLSKTIGTKMYEELCADFEDPENPVNQKDNNKSPWHIDSDDSSVTISITMPVVNRDSITIIPAGGYIKGTVQENGYYCNFIISNSDFRVTIQQENTVTKDDNKTHAYSSSSLQQAVLLPAEVEITSNVKAEYKDNMLKITLSKKQAPAKIPVL